MTTTTPDNLVNIPVPAGATHVCEWDNPRYPDPTAPRYFSGTQRFIDRSDDQYNGNIVVEIWGTQSREGDVKRFVDVLGEERRQDMTFSTSAHVRAFGEALIAAADEIDQMASRDVTIA